MAGTVVHGAKRREASDCACWCTFGKISPLSGINLVKKGIRAWLDCLPMRRGWIGPAIVRLQFGNSEETLL